jgi:hypothetical protein
MSTRRKTALGSTTISRNVIVEPPSRGSLEESIISLAWMHHEKDAVFATTLTASIDCSNEVTSPFKARPHVMTLGHEVQIPKMVPTTLTKAFGEGQPMNHLHLNSTILDAIET